MVPEPLFFTHFSRHYHDVVLEYVQSQRTVYVLRPRSLLRLGFVREKLFSIQLSSWKINETTEKQRRDEHS